MGLDNKSQILEILEYWKMVEFLGQVDLPVEKNENKKLVEKLKKGEKIKEKKVQIFTDIIAPLNVEKMLEEDDNRYKSFPAHSSEISFCIGRIERNAFVKYLSKYIAKEEILHELSYPKSSSLAWFSFKTDKEGTYVKDSFKLSSLVWAAAMWENRNIKGERDFNLNVEMYENTVKAMNEGLIDQRVDKFLYKLVIDINNNYIKKLSISQPREEKMGFCVYDRYVTETDMIADDKEDYTELNRSFYIKDIELFSAAVKGGQYGGKSEYEEKVLDYILSGYNIFLGKSVPKRSDISPKESKGNIRAFFEGKLDVNRAPVGKWPSRFMPVLMQQVAVNLAIDENGHTPVFSVNGPPGTGKTTMLKEIVAHNIVERAKLLAECGDNPDSAFEKRSFQYGELPDSKGYYKYAPYYYVLKNDKINDYGMLVASCNNAAVENITMDLPKGMDILDSLKSSDKDSKLVAEGLDSVYGLFDKNQSDDIEILRNYKNDEYSEQDIYFTRYANRLLKTDDCWGLISAPLGKKSNKDNYCSSVLEPFVNDYKVNEVKELHRMKYIKIRKIFLEQLNKVNELKKELDEVCRAGKAIAGYSGINTVEAVDNRYKGIQSKIESLEDSIRLEKAEINKLEQSKPKGLFKKKSVIANIDEQILERERNIASLHKDKEEYLAVIKELEKVKRYHKLVEKYSEDNRKMQPLDDDLIEGYMSSGEQKSTAAQIANPWFTAEYNREREKLFYYACKLQKEFVISSKAFSHNVQNLLLAWNHLADCDVKMKEEDRERAMPALLQNIFLITPVISTTFASAQTFLKDIKVGGALGTLIIDEAGQASPQLAIGSMFRCRKAIIVGDPRQIEPVVTAETDMINQLFTSKVLACYKEKTVSVQGFADYINPYGTYLGEDEERVWVGCPLVVHRRCIDPMYTISNALSYEGTMKQQTAPPKPEKEAGFILDNSYWIEVEGTEVQGEKNHFVNEQGEVVLMLLKEKIRKCPDRIPALFVITPFTSVKNGITEMIKRSALYHKSDIIKKWIKDDNIGTVHTFQGQGTDEVIFLLGCDMNSVRAANWVKKNIVNVAATRAKYRFYMIGEANVWSCKPVMIARACIGKTLSVEELKKRLNIQEDEGEEAVEVVEKAETVSIGRTDNPPEGSKRESKRDILVKNMMENSAENALNNPASDDKKEAPAGLGTCPKCGKMLVSRNGPYGVFVSCSGFPNCRYKAK